MVNGRNCQLPQDMPKLKWLAYRLDKVGFENKPSSYMLGQYNVSNSITELLQFDSHFILMLFSNTVFLPFCEGNFKLGTVN